MKTYLVLSETNYGESVMVVNAQNREDARAIADKEPAVWDNYTIEEINPDAHGVQGFYGLDGG